MIVICISDCPDFEVRFHCDCEEVIVTPTPYTPPEELRCYPAGSMYKHDTDCHKYLQCGANNKKVGQ